jgi:LAGLIDADG DNA endonuclease family
MDDGSYNKIKNNLILCTDSFSEKDILRLIEILKIKYDLSCGIIVYDKIKNTSRIRINKSSIPKLISIVKPYFIPSMYYKLGL